MNHRKLYLLRHIKSDWSEDVADEHRPVRADRMNDIHLVAEFFSSQSGVINQVKCSSALRTRQTASAFCACVGFDAGRIQIVPELYLCTIGTLRQVIAATPVATQHLLIVGHNPTLNDWLAHYTGGKHHHMSTSSLACFSFSGSSWKIETSTRMMLAWLAVPKALRSFKE